MPMSRAEVDRLARLARLRLSEEEVARMAVELESILGHLEDLRRAGFGGPGAGDRGTAPLREDRVGPDVLREPLAHIAPSWAEGYVVVPRPPALGPTEKG